MIAKFIKLYVNSVSGLSKEVWILSLVTFINRCGTMVIPFLSVYMTTELGFSIVEAGWVLFCFGVGSLAGSYLGGYLTDKIGYYWVMFWSLLGGGLLFVTISLFDSVVMVGLMVFLTSTVADAMRPAVMTAIAVYSRPDNRTRAYSLVRMAINFGWAMGPALGGWLVAFVGYWALFWADGMTCIAAALLFYFLMKIKEVKEEPAAAEPVLKTVSQSPYRDKEYLFFLFLTLIGAVVFMQFLYTLPVFYKEEMQFSELMIGNILAMNGLLIFFIEMPLVYTLERKFTVLENVWIGVLMFGLAYVLLNVAVGQSILIAVISMALLSIGEVFNMPFTNTYAMSRSSEDNRGAYMGLFTMTYSVAHIIGPPLGTQTVYYFGFATLWNLMGVLAVLSVIGYIYLAKKTKSGKAVSNDLAEVEEPKVESVS